MMRCLQALFARSKVQPPILHVSTRAVVDSKSLTRDSPTLPPWRPVYFICKLQFPHACIIAADFTQRDGETGQLLFRGHSIEDLWNCDFEEIVHLMVWEKLPSPLEKESLRSALATAMMDVPEDVVRVIQAFPYVPFLCMNRGQLMWTDGILHTGVLLPLCQ